MSRREKKKRRYIDVNIPKAWEPYLKEALENPEIQKQLEIGRFRKTYSGLGIWIIHQFLVEKTSLSRNSSFLIDAYSP